MTSLYDLAVVLRSKNAGPFLMTIDVMLPDRASFLRVATSPAFSVETISSAYGVDAREVRVIPVEEINTVKVTLPRMVGERGSGSPGDTDVYGAQHHGPLIDIEVE